MRLGICVHGAHFVNIVSPVLPEVTYQEVTLLFCGLYWQRVVRDGCACGPGQIFLRPLHCATCKDEGIVVHMRGGECFSGQVRDPVLEIVMTRRDKADPIKIEGVKNIKVGVAAFTLRGEVWGIYAISQEEGISPFLRTQFCPVYRGRLHR